MIYYNAGQVLENGCELVEYKGNKKWSFKTPNGKLYPKDLSIQNILGKKDFNLYKHKSGDILENGCELVECIDGKWTFKTPDGKLYDKPTSLNVILKKKKFNKAVIHYAGQVLENGCELVEYMEDGRWKFKRPDGTLYPYPYGISYILKKKDFYKYTKNNKSGDILENGCELVEYLGNGKWTFKTPDGKLFDKSLLIAQILKKEEFKVVKYQVKYHIGQILENGCKLLEYNKETRRWRFTYPYSDIVYPFYQKPLKINKNNFIVSAIYIRPKYWLYNRFKPIKFICENSKIKYDNFYHVLDTLTNEEKVLCLSEMYELTKKSLKEDLAI